ncbi:OmpA family protein [Xanthobacter sp. TB0139]|uniref:OmpA family protein n=1 Tax=Xanthobacter sp. TB0139 TaxID=3459178 RepID=UPI00403A42B2
MFSSLIAQISQKFGLSATQAEAVIRAALGFLEQAPQGLAGVVEQVKAAGLSGEPESWANLSTPGLDAEGAGKVMGSVAISSLAPLLGNAAQQAGNALGYALPKLLGLVTDHGLLPATLPDTARQFLNRAGMPAGLPADAFVPSKMGDWLARGIVFSAMLGALAWLTPWQSLPTSSDAAEPAAETAPAHGMPAHGAPTHEPPTDGAAPHETTPGTEEAAAENITILPAQLTLKEDNGVLTYSGVVADDDTRERVLAALENMFGADAIRGDIKVNPQATNAPWLPNLDAELASLKMPGLDAGFDGNNLKVNTLPAGTDRAALLAALRQSFASGSITLPSTVQPAADRPARLSLRALGDKILYRGSVPTTADADSVKATLAQIFGANNLSGDLRVDPRYQTPGWLSKLGEILGLLKSPGFNISFNGPDLNIRSLLPGVDQTALVEKLKALLGTDAQVKLPDLATPRLSAENAMNALNALQSGYAGNDVANTLNRVAIEFETGSATVPASGHEVILKAAQLIKALPNGAQIIIEGYTDNVGEDGMNQQLSQQRADAVKAIMIEAGLPADDISATGYGNANPVDTNDTPEGRAHNRRITYDIVAR